MFSHKDSTFFLPKTVMLTVISKRQKTDPLGSPTQFIGTAALRPERAKAVDLEELRTSRQEGFLSKPEVSSWFWVLRQGILSVYFAQLLH